MSLTGQCSTKSGFFTVNPGAFSNFYVKPCQLISAASLSHLAYILFVYNVPVSTTAYVSTTTLTTLFFLGCTSPSVQLP